MKWFHAIGASGKATANVAKMFKKMGWFVTGSDAQFLPPASNIIIDNKIPFDLGYSYKHLTKKFWEVFLKNEKFNEYDVPWNGDILNIPEHPDLCLIVESATDKNKEYRYALLNNIPVKPYSQILGEYLVKGQSIVVIGSAGKTTSTALLTRILQEAGLDPSYMIGADVIDLNDSLKNTNSDWSVLEGDEYHSKTLSRGAKFLEYKPKYLVITNVGWEHFEVFPTRDDYFAEFKKVVDIIPDDGLIVASEQVASLLFKDVKCSVVKYGENTSNDFSYKIINDHKLEQEFEIFNLDKKILSGTTNLWGKYNIENIAGVIALIKSVSELNKKCSENLLKKVIREFKGPKKRLEVILNSEELIIIDDFGIAPERAKNSLATLRKKFPQANIISVFEPNSGSRPKDEVIFKEAYKDVFKDANLVIIPELSSFNKDLANENDFKNWLTELGVAIDISSIDSLVDKIKNSIITGKQNVVVFFSAYRLDQVAKELAALS
ncbi:MAG: Mur ligase domain-containing protein [Candidatus Dojkabacteria bacterium]